MDRVDARAAERLASGLAHAGLNVTSVRPIASSLEDVFIARLHQFHGATA